MRQEDRQTLIDFETAVATVPNVLHAQRLFGDPDYLLRIVTVDQAAYQRLYDDTLANLPGVQRFNSTLGMKTIVQAPAAGLTGTTAREMTISPRCRMGRVAGTVCE